MKSIPGRKILVRSAGYRIGKSQAEREHYYNVAVEGVNFAEIFIDELIPEAEAGYEIGRASCRERV